MADLDRHSDAPEEAPRSEDAREHRRWSTGRRVLRVVGYVLAGIVGVVALLVLIVVLALQTEWGRGKTKAFALQRLNALFDGAELKAGDLRGNIIGNFTLPDAYLVTTEGDTLAQVDTLRASYNLLPLLQTRLELKNIDLIDPNVWMHQGRDGTWDLLNVIAKDDSVAVDTAATFFTKLVIKLDQLTVKDGYVFADFYAPGRDSTLIVDSLFVDLGEVSLRQDLAAVINNADAKVRPPGQSYRADFSLAGSYKDRFLSLTALRLKSPKSDVQGRGQLRMPGNETQNVRDVDFKVAANPLHFADINPFIPALEGQGDVQMNLAVDGAIDSLNINLDAVFSRGGTIKADGFLTAAGNGPQIYRLKGAVARLDPQTIMGSGVSKGLFNAEFDVDLTGPTLQNVSGTVGAQVADSRYGDYAVSRAVLNADVKNGQADFDLKTALRGTGIAAQGTIRPFDDIPTYNIAARVSDFNIGRFMDGSTMTSDLTARLTVVGSGFSIDTASVDARIDVEPSTVNGYPVESAALDVRLREKVVDFDARVLVPDGRFIADGGLNFRGEELTYEVYRGRFENVDVAALTGSDTTRSAFFGSFALSGKGTDPQTLSAKFDLNISSGVYGDINIAAANARGTLRSGLLNAAVDADLTDAGTLDLALTARPFRDAPTYTIERGVFRNLDLAALTGNAALQTDLSGRITGSGRGFDMQTLAFDGRIDLQPSRVNEQEISEASVDLTMRQGALSYDLYANLPEGQTRLKGRAQPFGDVPTYTVSDGRFTHLNLGALLGNPSLTSDLTGTLILDGRGFDPSTANIDARLALQPSRINEQEIESAAISLQVDGGSVRFSTRLELPEGTTQLAGNVLLGAEPPTYAITEGRLQNLNLGALLGNPALDTRLSGDLSLRGQGFDPATARMDAQIDLQPSRINRQTIQDGVLDASLRDGRLSFNLAMTYTGGETRLTGVARPFAETPTYRIDEGRFRNLDVGALAGTDGFSSRLTGRIETLEGTGFDLATARLDGRILLSNSLINRQEVDSAAVNVGLQGGNLAFDLFLNTGDGQALLAGTARPFDEVPTYAVNEGSFEDLDLGALLGRDNYSTRLTGDLSLTGTGLTPETMSLDAQLSLAASQINGVAISTGDVQVSLDDGLARLDADLVTEEGRAQVAGTAQPFGEVPTYDLSGRMININLGELIGADTLQARVTATFDIQGTGIDPETMAANIQVRGESSRYEDVVVERLVLDAVLRDGVLEADSLFLRSNVADVTASGKIALFDSTASSDFTFSAQIKDAETLDSFLAGQGISVGEGYVEGRAVGQNGAISFDVQADLASFSYGEYRVLGLDGRVSGELSASRELQLGDVNAKLGYVTIPGLQIQASDFSLTYEGNDLIFKGAFVVDAQREVKVQGRVDLREESRRAEIEDLQFRYGEQTFALLQPATITFGDAYRVSNFLLYSDSSQIAIDGIVDPNGTQNLVLTIEQFDLGMIADLIGFGGLDGALSGSVVLTGPAAAPNLEGSLALGLVSEGEDVGTMRVDLAYDEQRLNIEALLQGVPQGTLSINGFIPMDLSLAPGDSSVSVPQPGRQDQVDVGQGVAVSSGEVSAASGVQLELVADTFSIGWIDPFLDPETIRDLQGTLDADINISGTLNAPDLDGTFSLQQGRMHLTALEVTYRDVRAQGTLTDNVVQLDELFVRAGEGTLTGQGSVSLAELTLGEFDIDVALDNFRAIDNADFSNVLVSGNAHVEGTTSAPVINGDIDMTRADIFVENLITPDVAVVELSQRDINTLQEVFGYQVTAADTSTFVLFDVLTLNLDASIERDVWLRQRSNPQLAIQFSGDLNVTKQPRMDPQLFGTIDVVPQRSFVDYFGKRFDISSGQLVFNGDPLQFFLDVQARHEVRSALSRTEAQVVITLDITGRYGELTIEPGSEPDMPMTDIVSYLATGRPAGSFLNLQVGRDLAFGQLTSLVEGFASEEFGLDVVEIQYDPIRENYELVAGKYVSPKFFVSLTQGFGSGPDQQADAGPGANTEVTLEYEFYKWLLVRLIGGREELNLNLLWETSY